MVSNTVQMLSKEQQDRSRIAVAASGLTMVDGLAQDPMLVQVRLRNGELVYVKDLPAIDKEDPQPNGDYHIALVADHDGAVKSQAGAAWLFVEDDMLKSLTVYSDNTMGNELLPLADDGFLQFSTEGFLSEPVDEDGKYGDFWVTELAPVTTGNDPGTQVLNGKSVLITNAFKSQKKEEMMDKSKNEITPEEAEALKETIKAELKDELLAELQGEEAAVNDAESETDDAEDITPEKEKVEEKVENKVATTPKTVANARPVQPQVKIKNDMSSDGAMVAFSNAIGQAIRDHSGQAGVRAAMNLWKQQNAVTGDAIVPTQVAETFFKAWLDNENLTAFKFMNARVGAVYAATTTDTAQGHVKTDPRTAKTEQELDILRRDLKALAVYKKLGIDQQDVWDDASGNLIRLRAQELSSRITNQILVAALLGGTQEGSVGSTEGAGTRGLFGIVPDSAAASGTFGDAVASDVAGTNGEDKFAAVVRTIGSIVVTPGGNITSAGRSSTGITLFVPWSGGGASWVTELLLTQDLNGHYMFTGQSLESLLGVTNIVEVPELAATGQLIAVADGAYQLYGEKSPNVYPFFDTVYNVDMLLQEQFVAGSLAGFKQAAVYTPYDVSS